MPRAAVPHIFLRKEGGRTPIWWLRDGPLRTSLGLPEDKRREAERVLRNYAKERDVSLTRYTSRYVAADFVYFISCERDDFPIKIGIATDVHKRVRSLQTAMPWPVVLLAQENGGLLQETRLHSRFKEFHLRGEWFARNPLLMEHIDAISKA